MAAYVLHVTHCYDGALLPLLFMNYVVPAQQHFTHVTPAKQLE